MQRTLPQAAACAVLLTLAIGPWSEGAFAQSPAPAAKPAPMQGMAMPDMTAPADGTMAAAMDKMSKAMAAAPVTGDADQDFVAMMVPHHQGAVDMAQYELAHGKDKAIRKLARGIVAAQEKEIALMQSWQTKHPAKP